MSGRPLIRKLGGRRNKVLFNVMKLLNQRLLWRTSRTCAQFDRIDSSADHVRDLPANLRRILRVVTDVHVARITEPRHEVSINFGAVACIQQRVQIHFADVSGSQIQSGKQLSACGKGKLRQSRGRAGMSCERL